QVWRLFTSQTAFLETKDLICAALLIYYFRVFERRLGSKKFASHLLATSLISLGLQVPIILLIRSTGWASYHHGHLPPGPYGLIFPLFVPYLCDIPRMTRTHILGIPITGKTLTYLVGLQVCSTSFPTAVSAFCSIAAGLWYRWNVLRVQDWLAIPDWLARITDMTFGRLLSSSPPADGPMEVRPNDPTPPSEENVTFLTSMGFSRDRVMRALQTTGNNVEAATNLLLQE
ncbi:hypothetical protein DAPPUDRAFT_51066, partial [Daphnia pulex]